MPVCCVASSTLLDVLSSTPTSGFVRRPCIRTISQHCASSITNFKEHSPDTLKIGAWTRWVKGLEIAVDEGAAVPFNAPHYEKTRPLDRPSGRCPAFVFGPG